MRVTGSDLPKPNPDAILPSASNEDNKDGQKEMDKDKEEKPLERPVKVRVTLDRFGLAWLETAFIEEEYEHEEKIEIKKEKK